PGGQSEIRAQACLSRRNARNQRFALRELEPHGPARRSQCGAARTRRVESQTDVTSSVAHADRVREARRGTEGWRLGRRHAQVRSGAYQALDVVELPLD